MNVTGSLNIVGHTILSASGDGDEVVLELRQDTDFPWALAIANDYYTSASGSPGQFQFGAFVWNNGRTSLGTEVDKDLEFYTNGNYANPNLILSSSGIQLNSNTNVSGNLSVTGSLTTHGNITADNLTATYNISAGGYVDTPLLYHGGPLEKIGRAHV